MLGRVCRECSCDAGKKEAFEDLYGWAQEGDGTERGAAISWFSWFWKRNYDSMFPQCGNIGAIYGVVVDIAEEIDAIWTEVL